MIKKNPIVRFKDVRPQLQI